MEMKILVEVKVARGGEYCTVVSDFTEPRTQKFDDTYDAVEAALEVLANLTQQATFRNYNIPDDSEGIH